MSNTEDEKSADTLRATEKHHEASREDPLADTSRLISQEIPPGVDRRHFLIRSAVGGAAAVMTGRTLSAQDRTAMAVATMPPQAAAPPLAADLNVVKKGQGPVLTTVDEFYKVGPGPSSSHTIGPMRITHDFYERCTKLLPELLAWNHQFTHVPIALAVSERKKTDPEDALWRGVLASTGQPRDMR